MSPICFQREQVDSGRNKKIAGFFIAFCLRFDEMLAAGYRCNVTGQLVFHRDPRETPPCGSTRVRGSQHLSVPPLLASETFCSVSTAIVFG